MRHSDSRSEAQFREDLAAWLDDNQPAGERITDPPRSSGHIPDWAAAWQHSLFEAGWLVPRWPSELGGRDAGPVEQMIYLEEMSDRRLPRSTNPRGLDVCAPTLADHGSGAQRDEWLRATLSGQMTWCVAVDEVDAAAPGVDADDEADAVQLSMAELGDTLSLSGNVAAPDGVADAMRCLCAVRLETPGRNAAVTVVAVDLDASGVDRPAPSDAAEPPGDDGQLTFTDVRVSRDDVIGGRDEGWQVVRSVRARLRSTRWIASLLAARRGLDALGDVARARGLADDGVVRDTLAALHVEVRAARALAYRALARQTTGRPNPELALLPIVASHAEADVFGAGVDVLGADGLDLGLDGPDGWDSGSWAGEWDAAMARRARAGGLGVERDRIAGRVLGRRSH